MRAETARPEGSGSGALPPLQYVSVRTPLAVLKVQVQSALRGDVEPQTALLEITATGEQDQDPPWAFRKIHVHYKAGGRGLTDRALEQAIDTTPPLDAISAAALPILREYPPELPNQRYQRTGRLGRG